jgi:DNA-binding MarR family transcriptional regulator
MQRPAQIAWLMQEAVHYTRKAVDEAVRAHGVTVSQWAVLYRLARRPGLSGAELAREMLLTPQAAHQALTTLVRKGLVERKPDPNHARIFRAVLTDDGRRLAERCRADSLAIHGKLMAAFDTDEREAFTDLLRRYIDALATID